MAPASINGIEMLKEPLVLLFLSCIITFLQISVIHEMWEPANAAVLPICYISLLGCNKKMSGIWIPILVASVIWGGLSIMSVPRLLLALSAAPVIFMIYAAFEIEWFSRSLFTVATSLTVSFLSVSWFHFVLNWGRGDFLEVLSTENYLASALSTAIITGILCIGSLQILYRKNQNVYQ
jgi:hypothetical protein